MKALKPITSRLRNPRSRSLRLSVLVLAGAAMLSAIAAQTHRAPANPAVQDDAPIAPLVGRDYSMRLDVLRGRVQFFDASARIAGVTPIASHGCEADLTQLEPGLWLAVPQARDDGGTDLLLQPMGATAPGRRDGVVLTPCADAKSQNTALSGKVRAHILERGGGVVFVDAGAAPAAPDRSNALASKVP